MTELRVMASMHERKATMAESDAFIARPGGWGTREEFFEILTWGQLGLHRKACGLLNVQGYFDPMIAVADSPEDLLDRLASYDLPWTEKWIDRERS